MREDGHEPPGSGSDFEIVAKSARVDTNHNTRDARLARLAGDPIRLREAIAEASLPDGASSSQMIVLPASDSIAMIGGGGPVVASPKSKALPRYQEALSARQAKTFDRFERLDDDGIDKPDHVPADLSQIPRGSALVMCLLGIVAAAAFLLFAA